ncbi:iron-containing alcohol dehydrogenase, partial [bacterium]|nr:iron-containing alcohol dehydrogenase [bacterium]
VKLRNKAHYVAIATSSGTGSEATSSAVITDWEQSPPYKAGLKAIEIIPDVAIVDPKLTLSMTKTVTANTGIDALIHAIECYILIEPNPIVDSLALSAANTVFKWLPKAYKNGENLEARDQMHTAALMAGITFSNGRLGAVHVLAHNIGSAFGIPHGRSNALMLCPVFAHLFKHRKKRFADLATALGFKGNSYKEKTNNLLEGLDSLKSEIDIPLSIKKEGLKEKKFMGEIDAIVDSYMVRLGRILDGLTPAQKQEKALPTEASVVKDLYMHAWKGTREVLK